MLVLSIGATQVTTLEYGKINSHHPRIKTILPDELAKAYRENPDDVLFDFAISHSSIEHSGMGRYGDEMNPYGDVITVARVNCLLKQGGVFFMGVPTEPPFVDVVNYNAHRNFGPLMWLRVIFGFDVIDGVNPTQNEIYHSYLALKKE